MGSQKSERTEGLSLSDGTIAAVTTCTHRLPHTGGYLDRHFVKSAAEATGVATPNSGSGTFWFSAELQSSLFLLLLWLSEAFHLCYAQWYCILLGYCFLWDGKVGWRPSDPTLDLWGFFSHCCHLVFPFISWNGKSGKLRCVGLRIKATVRADRSKKT